MWNKINLNGEWLGWGKQVADDFVFFGNSSASRDKILTRFPELQIFTCQQVHGTQLVKAPFTDDNLPQADAVWATQPDTAVSVVTADCLPILITHPSFVCAVHAGWRGVVAGIIPKATRALLDLYSGADKLQIYIGPHILVETFEVKTDVLQIFQSQLAGVFLPAAHTRKHLEQDKCYIDLSKVASAQLNSLGIVDEQIQFLNINTYTDKDMASFRRTGLRTERNISFVARLQPNSRLI
jgi:YfiH family protein